MSERKSTLDLVGIAPKEYTDAHLGNSVAVRDTKTGKIHLATIRIKAVNCGKSNCHKCPHYRYAYAQFRDGQKVREKYLGVVK